MQMPLLRPAQPGLDSRFHRLRTEKLRHGAWIAHQSGWLAGDTEVFAALRHHTRWRAERRPMYDRIIDVPRQFARLPEDGPGHPILAQAARLLSLRFGRDLSRVSVNLYRDGRDSVAMHGDRVGGSEHDAIVAIVSLGAPRVFRLRPVGGGPGLDFQLGWGDLLVMGGTCQATWQHGIPKSTRAAGPRISVMFREARAEPAGSSAS